MSTDMIYENVPRLLRRTGDTVLAGSNNSTMVLGRDRVRGVDTGYGNGSEAGSIHLVVGRSDEDFDPDEDRATLYLSQRNDPDDFADTVGVGKPHRAKGVSAVIARADCIRISPREDFKLVVGSAYINVRSDGSVVIEGDVSLGEGASQRVIRESFARDVFPAHTHMCAGSGSPSGPVMQPVPSSVYNDRVKC